MVEIPGYKIEREVGRGGMANVYLAVQQSVERRVALKVMSPVLLVDPTFSERFIREAKIAANLQHPNIVAVHDVGLYQDHHFIAMEYFDGGDLAERCSRGMTQDEVLRVVGEIAAALDYAHAKGFVHRDVKPENILFREDDTVVLTDFGIARAVDSSTQMTKTGAVIGTPQYMSPEQARGQELDGRSDIYGLGIVMFELLTGNVPFEGADSVSVGIKHVTEPIPQLPTHMGHLQPLLDGFMQKDPDQRFQTGGQAITAIEAIQSGGQAQPEPEPTPAIPLDQTRVSDPGLETMVAPRKREGGVSATPRPDGTLRKEPTLGSIDDIHSFDRTIKQPAVGKARPARKGFVFALLAVVIIAAAGWWQQDRLMELFRDPGLEDLLQRALAAETEGRVYGDGDRYASTLFRELQRQDPGNRAARAGLGRVARYLMDLAEEARDRGNAIQADLLVERARELSEEAVEEILAAQAEPVPIPEPEPPPVDPEIEARKERLTTLLSSATDALSDGRLVGSGEDNAAAMYRQILEMEPTNAAARSGLDRIASTLRGRIDQALTDRDAAAAEERIEQLATVVDDGVELDAYRRSLGRLWDEIAEQERIAEQRRNRINGQLQLGESALAADRLGSPEGNNAIAHFRSVLELDPGNSQASDGLARIARRYLALTEQALEADRLEQAAGYIDAIDALDPALTGLDRARRRLALYQEQRDRSRLTPEREIELQETLVLADAAFERGEMKAPPGESAYDLYKAALRIDPRRPEALTGLRRVSGVLVDRSRDALRSDDVDLAFAYLGDARETDPQNPMLLPLAEEIAVVLRREVARAIQESRLDDADRLLRQASDLDPDHPDLAQLQLRLNIARE